MNCKPGDLAVIVRCCVKANIGMLVEVIRFEGPYTFALGEHHANTWICKPLANLKGNAGHIYRAGGAARIPDEFLHPLRDSDDDAKDSHELSLPAVPFKQPEAA